MRLIIKLQVGDGSIIFSWYDNWHLDDHLYSKYGHGAVSDAASSATAKLLAIISHQTWSWLPARSENLLSTQIMLPKVVIGELDW